MRIALLVALLAGLGGVMLINEIGITRFPPRGQFSDGLIRSFHPSDVRSCMGARAPAAIGDRTSQWHWHQCATTLAQTQARAGFDVRYWSLLLAGAFTLASAFGFALVVRFDRPPARVLRGRQLLTGAAARRAFAQTSKQERLLSGAGLEFLPGLTVSRERETRHWLIWGSVGAGKTRGRGGGDCNAPWTKGRRHSRAGARAGPGCARSHSALCDAARAAAGPRTGGLGEQNVTARTRTAEARTRLVRPLPKAAAERIREMED